MAEGKAEPIAGMLTGNCDLPLMADRGNKERGGLSPEYSSPAVWRASCLAYDSLTAVGSKHLQVGDRVSCQN